MNAPKAQRHLERAQLATTDLLLELERAEGVLGEPLGGAVRQLRLELEQDLRRLNNFLQHLRPHLPRA
jgi:hypothetical protein